MHDDAVQFAVEAWEAAVIAGRPIVDLERWASRVGANAAARMAGRRPAGTSSSTEIEAPAVTSCDRIWSPVERDRLLRLLEDPGADVLSRRMKQVIAKLCEGDMSLHRAARELNMERSNLRRSLKRAIIRLQAIRSEGEPPAASME